MEINDVLDEFGNHTGRTAARGTTLEPGEYYLAVQVWIRNEAGAYLIQQRALNHRSAPGIWATTAGRVLAGEQSVYGALREVEEELGLQLSPGQLTKFMRLKMPTQIEDVWLAEVLSTEMDTPQPGPEVNACKWASKQEIYQMIERGEFFKYSYFDSLPD